METQYLDEFPQWLKTLGSDAESLADSLERGELSEPLRRRLAGALNYLFKSLDLIPDGIEDLGFIDDAFVLRVACGAAIKEGASAEGAPPLDPKSSLSRLAEDVPLIEKFLDSDFSRIERYVDNLNKVVARGRSVADVANNPEIRAELARDVRAWAKSYSPPTFSRDDKNLVKLRSFFAAKLPP